MKQLLFVFLILIVSGGFAQQYGYFDGVIISSDTKEPLIGAHVLLKGDLSIGAIADLDGKFHIKLTPGSYTFIISFTGMQTETLNIEIKQGETHHEDIRLKPYVNELQGVVVKVGRFDRPIEEITSSMEIIKPELIANKNVISINTILDLTPGLNILDGEPQIRGGSGFTFGVGSKVGVFIDGMPVLSGDASRPYWDFIPTENIKQIEVVKGCASVLSGSNSTSGAIYIRTRQPGLEPETRIKAFGGFYSTPKYSYMKWWNDFPYIGGADYFHSRIIKKNTDFTIGANVLFDHGYIGAPRAGPKVKDTLTNFSDSEMAKQRFRMNFNLRHRSGKFKGLNYGLDGNFMYEKSNLTLAWLDDSAGFYRGYPGAVLLQNQFIFYLDPFVNFYSKVGITHNFKARIMHNDIQATNNQSNKSTVYYADYNFIRKYEFLKGFSFTGGLAFQYNEVFSYLYAGSGSPKNHLMNVSGYAEIQNNFFDLINFSIGGRLEFFSLNDSTQEAKPVFRAGASLKLMQETYLRVSLGQGYRYPTIAERFILSSFGSFAVFNNPNLVPETSWNAEVGVKQGFKFANYFGYLDVAVFQQEYQNTIEYLFGFWDSTYTYALAGFKFLNTGKSRITGIDISVTGKALLGDNINLTSMFGYTYILPKTLEPDFVFAHDYNPGGATTFSYRTTSVDPGKSILKYRFLHTVKADFQLDFKNSSAGVSFKYFSKIENLDKAIAEFEQATINTGGSLQPVKYMNYFYHHNNGNIIFDFRISHTFNGKHKFSIICDNLLNRWYSLRPLKAEPMRKIMVQYALKI